MLDKPSSNVATLDPVTASMIPEPEKLKKDDVTVKFNLIKTEPASTENNAALVEDAI